MTKLFLAALLMAAPSIASAIPTFNEVPYCRELAEYSGGSYSVEETCREREVQAKRNLAGKAVPQDIQKYCYDLGESAGGSNSILETCIEREIAAKKRLGY